MTKISETLTSTSIGAKARLYTTAANILRAANFDMTKAVSQFAAAVKKDAALFNALSEDYVTRVAADMRNASRTPLP